MENKALAVIPVNSPYLPLQGERVIRLVTIHPGSWVDDVRCELTNWPLDSLQRPKYQTLSYVWGSARVTEEIFLNGIPWQVTVNLSCALRYLRHSSHPAVFWIDALDLEERSAQVPLIRDIYSGAGGLTIFLGNGISHRTPRAFHKTHTPSAASHDFSRSSGVGGHSNDRQVVADFWDSWRMRKQRSNNQSDSALSVFCLLWSLAYDMSTTQTWPPPELLDTRRERDVCSLFEAVRLMLLSPWWSRVWVVQEIAVAREPVTVRLGDVSAPWDLLVRAAKHPCMLPESKSQSPGATTGQQEIQLQPEYTKVLQRFAPTILNIEALRARWLDGGGSPMLSLLQEFGHRGATDERDKVYALMGLARTNHPVTRTLMRLARTNHPVTRTLMRLARTNHPVTRASMRLARTNHPATRASMRRTKINYPAVISADYTMSVRDVYKRTAVFLLESTQTLAFLAGNQTRKYRGDLPSWVPDWGAIIEPGDRVRAAVIDLYRANYQWEHVRATSVDIYWTSWADGLRNLVEALRTLNQWRLGRIIQALASYISSAQLLLHRSSPKLDPALLTQIIEDANALSEISRSHCPASEQDENFTKEEMTTLLGAFSGYPSRAFKWLLNFLLWSRLGRSSVDILNLCNCLHGHSDPSPPDIVSHQLEPHLKLNHTISKGFDILEMQSLFTGVVKAVGERLITWDSGSENHALQVVYNWLETAERSRGIFPTDYQRIIANTLVGGLRAVEIEGDESVRYVKLGSQAESEQEQVDLMHWFATHLVPAVDKAMKGTPYYESLSAAELPSRLDNKPPSAMYSPQHFNMAMKLATEGRAFFVTTTGLGLGPSSVLPGDEVHILRSGQTHMVLRQTLHGSHTAFKLIGDCYLYPESPETSEETWKSCWPRYWRDIPQVPVWNFEPRREWVRLV
ncbi:hypothetical protein RB595_008179 [Gaeumannomyces hyphopodioides]